MKKIALLAVLLGAGAILLGQTLEAWAACPPGTTYRCVQGMNGKVICSCS